MEPPNVWQDRLPAKFKEVGPRLVRLKVKDMKFVGGVFSYSEAGENEDGTWCDWWLTEDLKYPLVRLMAAAGYPRDEITVIADHDGRHAQGLLGAEGPPRGHGHQPHRGVAVLPDVPALLRPDVPRAQGQGARGPLREGVQRLDVRRVVRRLRRPPRAAADRAAVGRRTSRPTRSGATRRAVGTRCASPRSRRSSGCPRCTTRTATGTRSSRRARRPRASSACTSARARRCRRRRPTRRPPSARRSRT